MTACQDHAHITTRIRVTPPAFVTCRTCGEAPTIVDPAPGRPDASNVAVAGGRWSAPLSAGGLSCDWDGAR